MEAHVRVIKYRYAKCGIKMIQLKRVPVVIESLKVKGRMKVTETM